MNKTKIMTEILKSIEKQKPRNVLIGFDKNYVVVGDMQHLYRIHESEFCLDYKKLLSEGVRDITTISKLFNDEMGAKEAIATGVYKEKEKKKGTLKELKCGDDLIYIDIEYLKNFDKDCTFKGTGSKKPVYVYEYEILAGLILPVVIKN